MMADPAQREELLRISDEMDERLLKPYGVDPRLRGGRAISNYQD